MIKLLLDKIFVETKASLGRGMDVSCIPAIKYGQRVILKIEGLK